MYELLHEFVAPHSSCAGKYKNQIERYKCAGGDERSVRMLHEFVAPHSRCAIIFDFTRVCWDICPLSNSDAPRDALPFAYW